MSYSELYVNDLRNRTSIIVIMYSLYLYFLGLSLRNTSNALDIFDDEKRSHIAIWNWIQRFGSCNIYNKRKRILCFIIDETVIQIGNQILVMDLYRTSS